MSKKNDMESGAPFAVSLAPMFRTVIELIIEELATNPATMSRSTNKAVVEFALFEYFNRLGLKLSDDPAEEKHDGQSPK